MGLFKKIGKGVGKLFKKKEGGSIVGNLLRTAGDAVTGGLYSKVLKAPPVGTELKGDMQEVLNQIKLNQNKGNMLNSKKGFDLNELIKKAKDNIMIVAPAILAVGYIVYNKFFSGKKTSRRK